VVVVGSKDKSGVTRITITVTGTIMVQTPPPVPRPKAIRRWVPISTDKKDKNKPRSDKIKNKLVKIKDEFRNSRDNSQEVNNDRCPPLVRTIMITPMMVKTMIMSIRHRFARDSDKVKVNQVNSRVWVKYRALVLLPEVNKVKDKDKLLLPLLWRETSSWCPPRRVPSRRSLGPRLCKPPLVR
jgi:hypothetical protein